MTVSLWGGRWLVMFAFAWAAQAGAGALVVQLAWPGFSVPRRVAATAAVAVGSLVPVVLLVHGITERWI